MAAEATAPRQLPAAPPAVSGSDTGNLVDEPLDDGTVPHLPLVIHAPAAHVGADASAAPLTPLGAPSPVDTIRATTPPNVAAATRLADAGRTRLAAGDDAGALEQLERAIATDPNNGYAYFFLAELHLGHRSYDQAIAFAERAASLHAAAAPQWAARAYALQGAAFEAAGRFADARGAYARAVRLAPDNRTAQVGLARLGSPGSAAP